MKIATFLTTALANVGIGFVVFFMLILSLNGFHEDESTPGLLLYIVWGLLSAIVTGVLGVLLANYLTTKRSFSKIVAAAISIVAFIIVGGISTIVGFFAAVLLTSAMR